MTDDEIMAMADGMFLYLRQHCTPHDALAVIMCLVLQYYFSARNPATDFPIKEFTEKLGADLIDLWNKRQIVVEGPSTVQ